MPGQNVQCAVCDCFYMTDGQAEFFCKTFVSDSVNQSAFEDPAVPFGVDVFVNEGNDK